MIDYSFLLQLFLRDKEIIFPSFDPAQRFAAFLFELGYDAKILELPRILFDLSTTDIKDTVFFVSRRKPETVSR